MRSYHNFDLHYQRLLADVYPQPEDPDTTALANQVIDEWITKIQAESVLDVGCGEGFLQEKFEALGMYYKGIALGVDVQIAKSKGRNVVLMDFNFLDFYDGVFDLIFSRHSLEHSPFPLLTLMEWHRVSRHLLCLVLPNPKHFGWDKPNHYGIMTKALAVNLLERASWEIIWNKETEQELWFLCQKKNPFYENDARFVTYEEVIEANLGECVVGNVVELGR